MNLLRAGRVFVFEPPPGVKANLLRTFSTIPTTRMNKAPNERARLYFLVAWFHAIIQERLTYTPLGWSKKYEFNESDLRCACDTLDIWIESVAMVSSSMGCRVLLANFKNQECKTRRKQFGIVQNIRVEVFLNAAVNGGLCIDCSCVWLGNKIENVVHID